MGSGNWRMPCFFVRLVTVLGYVLYSSSEGPTESDLLSTLVSAQLCVLKLTFPPLFHAAAPPPSHQIICKEIFVSALISVGT